MAIYQQHWGDDNWKTCDLEGNLFWYTVNYSAISQVIFTQINKAYNFFYTCVLCKGTFVNFGIFIA